MSRRAWHLFAYLPLLVTAALVPIADFNSVVLPCLVVSTACWAVGILKRG